MHAVRLSVKIFYMSNKIHPHESNKLSEKQEQQQTNKFLTFLEAFYTQEQAKVKTEGSQKMVNNAQKDVKQDKINQSQAVENTFKILKQENLNEIKNELSNSLPIENQLKSLIQNHNKSQSNKEQNIQQQEHNIQQQKQPEEFNKEPFLNALNDIIKILKGERNHITKAQKTYTELKNGIDSNEAKDLYYKKIFETTLPNLSPEQQAQRIKKFKKLTEIFETKFSLPSDKEIKEQVKNLNIDNIDTDLQQKEINFNNNQSEQYNNPVQIKKQSAFKRFTNWAYKGFQKMNCFKGVKLNCFNKKNKIHAQ